MFAGIQLEEWAALIRALASLAWPTVILLALFLFKNEIRNLLDRLRRGKLPGGLELELDRLEERTVSVERRLPVSEEEPEVTSTEQKIRELAADNPRLAVMELSSKLEVAARTLHFHTFSEESEPPRGLRQTVRELEGDGDLEEMSDLTMRFSRIRNAVVHGLDQEISEAELLRAVDLGLRLYRILRTLLDVVESNDEST